MFSQLRTVNLTVRIQMRVYDLLSGTLTFLLFVILTPFVGAGSHAASCLSLFVRESRAQPCLQTCERAQKHRCTHYHSLHINFTQIHSVFTVPRNSAIIMIIASIHERSI